MGVVTPPGVTTLIRTPELLSAHSIATALENIRTAALLAQYAAAVALGAVAIEKHITMDKKMSGPDHSMSAGPMEFAELVSTIREVEKSLGDGVKKILKAECDIRKTHRKSIVAKKKIRKGEKLKASILDVRRPQGGIEPMNWDIVVNRKAKRTIEAEEAITWDMVD